MANVVFYQIQNFFNADSTELWDRRSARLVVYDDDVIDPSTFKSLFHFVFHELDEFKEEFYIGNQRIPVGTPCYDITYDSIENQYKKHKEKIERLLEEENLKPQVILYTSHTLFKEAFYYDYDESMKCNCKANEDREIMYWSLCGKNDCALIIAFEDLSIYSDGQEYMEKYMKEHRFG